MKVLQEILVPQESVNDSYLTVLTLNFKNNDAVKKDDVVIELETSKAGVEIHADVDGFVFYCCKEGDEVPLNSVIVKITDVPVGETSIMVSAKETPRMTSLPINHIPSEMETGKVSEKQKFAPVFSKKALVLIQLHNLDKEIFTNLDFVNEDKVLDYLEPERRTVTQQQELPKKPPVYSPLQSDKIDFKKISAYKKREIEYLSAVQKEGLIHTIFVEVDFPATPGGGVGPINSESTYFRDSMLPLLIYETSRLLVKYPELNSFFNNGYIGYYKEVNIGIAMNIDDGLKVVKVPQPDKMNMNEIEEKIFSLANDYLDKKLLPGDLTDITFTITDLSANGAYFFNPLINKDNAAIMAVSKIDRKLNRIILGITFDHRVSEGKTVTTFLNELKQRVESYLSPDKVDTDSIMCYKCMLRLSEDINGKGFIKVITATGEEKLICDLCYFNF